MSKVYIQESTLTSIANAIRTKNESSTTYKPGQMAQAILDIETGFTKYNVLCFTANTAGSTLYMNRTYGPIGINLQYSYDNETWIDWNYSNKTFSTITLSNVGDKVYIRGNNPSWTTNATNYYQFFMTGSIAASGNIMSLISYDATTLTTPSEAFVCMFKDCTSLTSAPELPATTISSMCYAQMFQGCTNLIAAPMLPAMNLTFYCYFNMFKDCTHLITPPALPAMTLAESCYCNMFYNCSALKTVPTLPCTTLTSYCYESMFQNCTNLTDIPALPATTLASNCYKNMFNGCSSVNNIKTYATSWNTTYTENWLSGVASTGVFYKPANTSIATGVSGIPSGWSIINI